MPLTLPLTGTITVATDGTVTGTLGDPTPPPPPPPASGALVGATVNIGAGFYSGCGGGPVNPCNAKAFDSAVSHGLASAITPAQSLQKVYLAAGLLPATPPAEWVAFAKQGGKLLISFKPPKSFSTASDDAFKKCIEGCISAFGASGFKAVLWQEPNTTSGFATATEYHDYFNHYAPLVKAVNAGVACVYDPALTPAGDSANEASVTAYYPGDTNADELMADYYGSSYNGGARLDCLTQLAAPGKKPVGLGEWAVAAIGGYTFDPAGYAAYTDYLATYFGDRLAQGLPVGWVVWWGSGNVNGIKPGSPAIAGFQKVYAAVTA